MQKRDVGSFKYFVGISSLAQIATRQDRVCVLNILGGELRQRHTGQSQPFPVAMSCSARRPGRRGQVHADADRRHPGLQQRAAKVSTRATSSTAASSICRPPACATAWPS